MKFSEQLKKEVVFMDGAVGTVLYEAGLDFALPLETVSVENRGSIMDLHRAYVEAGSDIIFADTFGVNRRRLWGSAINMEDFMASAIRNARRASRLQNTIGFYISPVGGFYEPVGDLTDEFAKNYYGAFARCGEEGGAEVVMLENFWDMHDIRNAIEAIKDNTKLAVMAAVPYGDRNFSLSGLRTEDMVTMLEDAGVDAVGHCCAPDIENSRKKAEAIANKAKLPIFFKPNCCQPNPTTFKYDLPPEKFAELMLPYITELGYRIVGGCCGTTPEYIKILREKVLTNTEKEI